MVRDVITKVLKASRLSCSCWVLLVAMLDEMLGEWFFSAERFLIIEMPNNKSENNEHRRAYTLMSQEDVANGKKSHWTELEVTATIRNLSPQTMAAELSYSIVSERQ